MAPHLTDADFHRLAAMNWKPRYAEIVEVIQRHCEALKPGTTMSTGTFAVALFPELPLMDNAARNAIFHWLKVVAQHNQGLALAGLKGPGKGYMKGKIVTRYVWGRAHKGGNQ